MAEKITEIKAPKGTKDILPEEAARWDDFFKKVEEVFKTYGYARIDTPLFESERLFARAIGETTDIVNKEMYVFEDKGGRRMALRPEETAGVVRAYIEHKMYAAGGLTKLYYKGPMFRYERPQGGRQRQFWQVGVEALGSADPALDAEVIDLAYTCLSAAGLNDLKVAVNSVGCTKCRPAYSDGLRAFLAQRSKDLCETCRERAKTNPLRVFDCKNEKCAETLLKAPAVTDHICEDCLEAYSKVKVYLDSLAVPYQEDKRLVRGLDYYTNTTFEISSAGLGAQDAVAAGGRYDGLVASYGGPAIPGLGFAVGVERVLLALGDVPGAEDDALDAYFVALNDEAKKAALSLAKGVRESGLTAEVDFSGKALKKQMANANKSGADYTVIIGEDEMMTGCVTVRNMRTGDQRSVSAEELSDTLKEKD